MRVIWITAIVVLLDQLTKVIVLNTMYLGQSIPIIGDWLRFTFTENPGMAFGITFGPRSLVTILSIGATLLIIGYMITVREARLPYRMSLALILGGALGNIIDRVFYGVILGYDTFFVGRVVDFIHVNLWRGYVPESIPFFGGSYIALFPIWNVADMAIVAGVAGILIFQHYAIPASAESEETEEVVPTERDQATDAPLNGRPVSEEEPQIAPPSAHHDDDRPL